MVQVNVGGGGSLLLRIPYHGSPVKADKAENRWDGTIQVSIRLT